MLYKDENTGGVDVVLDPGEPEHVYAVLWEARQGPWENGAFTGPGSGLFKSTDGGTTWTPDRQGSADVRAGRTRPHRHHARAEHADAACSRRSTRGANGGLYRSDDAGESWHASTTDDRVVERARRTSPR